MPSKFASPCWECKHKSYATNRCREDKAHTDCDWKDDDRYRDQQEKKAKRTSETSSKSPLHPWSTQGGGAAERPEDGDTGAKSCDNMPGVEGDVGEVKKGCDCSSCTASKYYSKCWECHPKGGKYKQRRNNFHRCRTESGHTGVDWKQDKRAGQEGGEEVGALGVELETVCTECQSGYEEALLLCDGPGCKASWHIQCLDPPLSNVPDGEWFCPLCVCGEGDGCGTESRGHGKLQDIGGAATNRKPVDKVSLEGKFISRHESMTDAALVAGVSKVKMCGVIKDGSECANHYWRYVKGNGGGEDVNVPRKTPTKHDVAGSDDKPPGVKKVYCSDLKGGTGKPDGSEGGCASGGSGRRGGASASGCDADSIKSFKTSKDQGWGKLLDSKLVKPGDTIRPPGRGQNKDRSAQVQSNGTLLEVGVSLPWIDPVAFLVSSNDWKDSATFKKDRNRFGNCIRVRGDKEDVQPSLCELKSEARLRNGLEGHARPPSIATPNNLKPTIGARVQVRFDVDTKIKWFKGQLVDFDKTTCEWKIKLDLCTKSRVKCDGCYECVHHLAAGTKDWAKDVSIISVPGEVERKEGGGEVESEDSSGGLYNDPVAFVVQNNNWHANDPDTLHKMTLKCRSIKYFAPGRGVNSSQSLHDLLVGQGQKKFGLNWTSLCASGKVEENGILRYQGQKITRKGRFVRNGGRLCIEEVDDDEGHAEEQSSRRADQMEKEEEEVGEGGGSKSEGFSTSHRNVSDGLEGQSRSHSTRRSSARSSEKNRIPDLGLPTTSFGLRSEREEQRPRPQKSNDLPLASDVADENPIGDTGSHSGRGDEGHDDGNDDGGDRGGEGPYRSDDKDTSPVNCNVVRLRILPPKTESRSALHWPVGHDDDLTILKVHVYVGEPRTITAHDWGVTGAEFVDLVDSIAANPRLSITNENGQDFTATFQSLVTDEDQHFRTVPVKMRFSSNAKACDCKIVFKVTAHLQYASPERILKPKKQTTVFKLEDQPANCEILSPAQMGQFLLHPKEEGPEEVVLLDCAKWLELDSTSGQLTVNVPKMEDLPMDSGKRTQVFCITRTNRMGEVEIHDLVMEFVQILFIIPDKMIKGQALNPAIVLASTPDILPELGVSIIDIGDLSRYGFKISDGNLEIAGTPNAVLNCLEHEVTINCPGLSDISVKLLLPRVETWKPPRLAEKAVMQITSFGLDKKIAEVKASAATHNYGFIEQCMGSGTPVPKGKDGWYELTMIFGVETKAKLEYVDTNLSGLEEVKVEGLDPKKGADIKIYVKDGHLVIEGKPRARTRDSDLLIDPSHKRFRHLLVTITPQNQGGDGQKVMLIITCRPWKKFLGVAQSYTGCKTEGVKKLECCELDLTTLIDDHCRLGFDLIMWCLDTPVGVIEKARKDFKFGGETKSADNVVYLTGHGYENDDGYKSYLLVVDQNGSADWHIDSGNVCIQNELEEIAKEADNSDYPVLIIDACRLWQDEQNGKEEENGEVGKNQASQKAKALKLKMNPYFKQQVVWWATSKQRIARGGGEGEMSLFSKYLHDGFEKVIAGDISELKIAVESSELYIGGIPALKSWVHSNVCGQAAIKLRPGSSERSAQQPLLDDTKAREAFTWALPPRPVLPLPDAPSDGTDPRWKKLWNEKKVVCGDMILYMDQGGATEIIGQVQHDGRIGLTVGRICKYYIDAVALGLNDNDWASPDFHIESLIETHSKVFACCYLCDPEDPDKEKPLEDLLSSCGARTPEGGAGKATRSSGKGKESAEPHGDDVAGESGGAQARKRSREESPCASSKEPMEQHDDAQPSKHSFTRSDSSAGISPQPQNVSSLGEGSAGVGAGRKRGRENESGPATEEDDLE